MAIGHHHPAVEYLKTYMKLPISDEFELWTVPHMANSMNCRWKPPIGAGSILKLSAQTWGIHQPTFCQTNEPTSTPWFVVLYIFRPSFFNMIVGDDSVEFSQFIINHVSPQCCPRSIVCPQVSSLIIIHTNPTIHECMYQKYTNVNPYYLHYFPFLSIGVSFKTFMYMYVCTYVRMYVCTYVRMYVCTYVCTYVRMYVRMYVCTYVGM